MKEILRPKAVTQIQLRLYSVKEKGSVLILIPDIKWVVLYN